MKNEIIKVGCGEWRRFQSFLAGGPCCNSAFPQGECFGILTGSGIESIAAMVWYTYVFRNSPYRLSVMAELRGLARGEQIDFLNKNVRLLARVSTLPDYRLQGYARRLVEGTVNLLGVQYIECLTAWGDVRRLLKNVGFTQYQGCGSSELDIKKDIDYWLWRRS